jgi:4-diphosphocytidyl-2-C-methyl-D-erythritol kinase
VTTFRELAPAKLNLTLEVLGRRADGYHELASLVAFAGVGDSVELAEGGALELLIDGPFAAGLIGSDNLICQAALAAKELRPALQLGRFSLTKALPVASGIGGGSADAAAALRLLAHANAGTLTHADLVKLASGLGSDVSVCLSSRPALMTGRGEKVWPVSGFPPCGVVLANPGLALASAAVYGALKAPSLPEPPSAPPAVPDFAGSFARLLDYALPRGNFLQPPAMALAPQIATVLAALEALPGTRLVRLSGSGPTCFALFAEEAEARAAASRLAASHADWWVAASTLA